MSDESLDLFEEESWSEVEQYAKETGMSTRYIEEEEVCLSPVDHSDFPSLSLSLPLVQRHDSRVYLSIAAKSKIALVGRYTIQR